MRALALNELQFVSGGGDLPEAPDVYSTGEILATLEADRPPVVNIALAAGEVVWNFGAAVNFGLTAIVWSIHQLTC